MATILHHVCVSSPRYIKLERASRYENKENINSHMIVGTEADSKI
jgi:hypothetical protein